MSKFFLVVTSLIVLGVSSVASASEVGRPKQPEVVTVQA
jgi:hypothetical protein